ncbi:hypothetical protein [Nibribacter koreensis]|uniref:YARHG domain-containing protein n=1 Tax=Nibribacter koreensis TaxID=1084519 RepID=A0ABP8FBK8_9BACT
MPAKASTNLIFGTTDIVTSGYVSAEWNRRFYREGYRWMRGAYIKRGTTPQDYLDARELAEEYNNRFKERAA